MLRERYKFPCRAIPPFVPVLQTVLGLHPWLMLARALGAQELRDFSPLTSYLPPLTLSLASIFRRKAVNGRLRIPLTGL